MDEPAVTVADELRRLQALADEKGIGLGDLVYKLASILKIPHCGGCEERRQVLNKLRVPGGWDRLREHEWFSKDDDREVV